jgi:hypothetical protein
VTFEMGCPVVCSLEEPALPVQMADARSVWIGTGAAVVIGLGACVYFCCYALCCYAAGLLNE